MLHFILFMFLIKSQLISCDSIEHYKTILLSFDGFRWDYLGRVGVPTPNLDALIKGGLKAEYLKPQFVTKTFPNHQSIATGLHTESHGVIDNHLFDPEVNLTLSAKNERFWNSGNSGNHVVPIWIWNEWSGYKSAVQFPGSETPYGHNRSMATIHLNHNKSRPFEERVDYIIKWLSEEIDLAVMYFEEPDGMGHKFGPDSPEVSQQIVRMDGVTGYLLGELGREGLLNKTNLIIVSDHGMTEIKKENIINLKDVMDLNGRDYEMFGKSPILQIKPRDGAFSIVYDEFKEASVTRNFTVYAKDEIPDSWHYKNNVRTMPIILLADPGWVFDDYHHFENGSAVQGLHGYSPEDPNMRGIFIASGPSFRKGVILPPFENVDVFPLLCKIMAIPIPPTINGSLDIVRMSLKQEFSGASSILTHVLYYQIVLCLFFVI